MNRIDKMIQEMCPDGVEHRPLSRLTVSLKKSTLKTSELIENGAYPVMNSGRTYYGRYNDYNNENAITIAARGEYAGFVNYIENKFWAGGLCYPYKSKDEERCLTKYLYYILKSKQQYIMDVLVAKGSIPALNKQDIDKITIPLVPLEIQKEIVKVLDNFTRYSTGLQAELQARIKQYEYYRDKLFEHNAEPEVELNEVIESLNTGLNPRRFFKLNTQDAKNAYITIREIHNGGITPTQKTDKINDEALKLCNKRSNLETGDILFSGTGTVGETAVILEEPTNWNIKEGVYAIKPKKEKVNSFYLKYLLDSRSMRKKYMSKIVGGTVRSLSMKELRSLKISLPSLEVQSRTVSLLKNFDNICNSFKSGLPAEIAARQKQYEYYRDKLLTFKKLETEKANG